MNSITPYQNPVSGRKYSLEILQILGVSPQGLSFMELYRRTHASKPCVSFTIKDLIHNSYVEKDPSGLYKISSKGLHFLSEVKTSGDEIPFWGIELLVQMVEKNLNQPIRDKKERLKLEDFFRRRIESQINYAAGYITAKMESEEPKN